MSDVFNLINGAFFGGNSGQSGISGFFGIPSEGEYGQATGAQYQNWTKSTGVADLLTEAAQREFGVTSPLRESIYKRAHDVLSGNYNPMESPAYEPMRRSVEGSYGQAKENILANLPTGGVQKESLANLETDRATNLNDIMSSILTGELQNAYGLGTQSYPQYLQALSAAGTASAVPGQIIGSLLEYLVGKMTAGVQAAGNASPF